MICRVEEENPEPEGLDISVQISPEKALGNLTGVS